MPVTDRISLPNKTDVPHRHVRGIDFSRCPRVQRGETLDFKATTTFLGREAQVISAKCQKCLDRVAQRQGLGCTDDDRSTIDGETNCTIASQRGEVQLNVGTGNGDPPVIKVMTGIIPG